MKTTDRLLNDTKSLNRMFLDYLNDYCRRLPDVSRHFFGVDANDVERITTLSQKEISDLAGCGRLLMHLTSPLSVDSAPTICPEDIRYINTLYLMMAKNYSSIQPLESAWVFGLNQQQLNQYSKMSLEKIRETTFTSYPHITLWIHEASESHVGIGVRAVMTQK